MKKWYYVTGLSLMSSLIGLFKKSVTKQAENKTKIVDFKQTEKNK